MSFIVKDVDLPKEGRTVIIEVFPNGRCSVMEIEAGECYDLEIRSKTEAVQIPKGHGRLIDIEKLKEEFAMKNNICKECDSFKKCDNKTYSKSEICEKFIWVPTILESEGGE